MPIVLHANFPYASCPPCQFSACQLSSMPSIRMPIVRMPIVLAPNRHTLPYSDSLALLIKKKKKHY